MIESLRISSLTNKMEIPTARAHHDLDQVNQIVFKSELSCPRLDISFQVAKFCFSDLFFLQALGNCKNYLEVIPLLEPLLSKSKVS